MIDDDTEDTVDLPLHEVALGHLDNVHREQWRALVELNGGDLVRTLTDVLHHGIGSAHEMRERQRRRSLDLWPE